MMQYNSLNKENLNQILSSLAKHYRKAARKGAKVEIVLVGGAAVLANYHFREMTMDIDAFGSFPSLLNDIANTIGDEFHLENGWFNSDFMRTPSYSPRLLEYSKYYKTFSNVLEVRTVSGEYLIAMKLRSARAYKSDWSDVAGILNEHLQRENPISIEQINTAVQELYDGWKNMPIGSQQTLLAFFADGNYERIYDDAKESESANQNTLLNFSQKYKGVTNMDNANEILSVLNAKKKQGE